MNGKNLFWVLVAVIAAVLIAGLGKEPFLNNIRDRVILKLQKEYSPSPYGPGVDPDKIDVNKIK